MKSDLKEAPILPNHLKEKLYTKKAKKIFLDMALCIFPSTAHDLNSITIPRNQHKEKNCINITSPREERIVLHKEIPPAPL